MHRHSATRHGDMCSARIRALACPQCATRVVCSNQVLAIEAKSAMLRSKSSSVLCNTVPPEGRSASSQALYIARLWPWRAQSARSSTSPSGISRPSSRQPCASTPCSGSPLLKVRTSVANGIVYVSGNLGVDMQTLKVCPGGVHNETICAFKNIARVLEVAGSSLEDVVEVRRPARHSSLRNYLCRRSAPSFWVRWTTTRK